MVKYLVKFIFDDGSIHLSNYAFDSLSQANEHGEHMLVNDYFNSQKHVVRFVVGVAEICF